MKITEKDKLGLLFNIAALIVIVHVINVLLNYQLLRFGLFPRDVNHLWGILTAPFLHGSATHLINNLVGLMIFGLLCLFRSKRFFIQISIFIILFSGLAVWMFGRPSIHIGASGWVFGLWSACIAIAWKDRRIVNILIAVFVIFFYGGMIYGVLPTDPKVSFEYHLAGAIGGVLAVLFFPNKRIG